MRKINCAVQYGIICFSLLFLAGCGEAEEQEEALADKINFEEIYDKDVVSMYFQEKGDSELELRELSFIKVKFSEYERRETVPKTLYELLERNYYEAQEEIAEGEWVESPGKTKATIVGFI